MRLEGDRVSDLRFEGKGCAISVASASLMCEAVKGKRRAEIAHLFDEIHEVLTHHDAPVPEDLGKLAALSGVREFPVRVKCASLCWHTLNAALERSASRSRPNRTVSMRTHDNEPFVLRRDVKAVMVPAGIELELKSGQSGFITQALGGSFTLYMEGNLFRLAGADADAIGKEVVEAAGASAERHRRRRAGAGLGPAAHLLRPGDPDQHRGPWAYLRVHGERAA